MQDELVLDLKNKFLSLEDPRVQVRISHLLIDILVITVCAVISGAESWYEIEEYAKSKESFLKRFLKLPNSIPRAKALK